METSKNLMDKQITSGAVGSQSELPGDHLQPPCSERNPDRAALNLAETETIRSFAEHVVRLLCERHHTAEQDSR